jgi:VanZ family protein
VNRGERAHAWPGWLAWALWTFLIFFLTSFPRRAFPRLPPLLPWDKIVHAIEWGIWAALLFAVMARQFPRLAKERIFLTVTLGAAAGGILHEVHQLYVPGRQCDPADWLADMTGAIVVAGIAVALSRTHSRA